MFCSVDRMCFTSLIIDSSEPRSEFSKTYAIGTFADLIGEYLTFSRSQKLINHRLLCPVVTIIDLTLSISKNIPTFPGSPSPQFITWSSLKDDGYNLELLFLSSHTGTHIDAPFHFNNAGMKIQQIQLRRLIGNAILMTIKKTKDQLITRSDITRYEKIHGSIPKNAIIIFYTGWQKNQKKNYFFTNNPGLSIDAAQHLVSRQVNLVGIDSPSIDAGKNSKFNVHKILSQKNILIVENLSNLEKITQNNFHFIALPLKLQNATGSPIRALAIQ